MKSNSAQVNNCSIGHWFRESSPYIQAHRDKTFVINLPGEAIAHENIETLLRDLAQITHLGIRLVLVHGIRPQIESCLGGDHFQYHRGVRVTDDTAMECVRQVAGNVRLKLESQLSRALCNLPLEGAYARTVSGNHITAQPFGIHDGIDFQHTGMVRRVDADAIHQQLDNGAIVIISPIGYSPTGEIFNLTAEDVAEATASALQADKLIVYSDKTQLRGSNRKLLRQLTRHEAQKILQGRRKLSDDDRRILESAVRLTTKRVKRIHLLNWRDDAAILQELFTRDGVGTMISAEAYDTIRQASAEDIPGILQVIEPLESKGLLVKRPRDQLEMEIEHFHVMVRDDTVVGCAAIYCYPEAGMAELACLAMSNDYRGHGSGNQLLKAVQDIALKYSVKQLFVLTTQSAHWFRERGFQTADLASLPLKKRQLYNYQRRSRIYIKPL